MTLASNTDAMLEWSIVLIERFPTLRKLQCHVSFLAVLCREITQ